MNARMRSGAALTDRERVCLAALRITALAADRADAGVSVRRGDVLVLLTAVDRLLERPTSQAEIVIEQPIAVAYFASEITVHSTVIAPEPRWTAHD